MARGPAASAGIDSTVGLPMESCDTRLRGVFHFASIVDDLELRLAILRLVVPPDCVVTDRTAGWLWGANMILAPNDHLQVPPVHVFSPPGYRLRNGLVSSGERMLSAADVASARRSAGHHAASHSVRSWAVASQGSGAGRHGLAVPGRRVRRVSTSQRGVAVQGVSGRDPAACTGTARRPGGRVSTREHPTAALVGGGPATPSVPVPDPTSAWRHMAARPGYRGPSVRGGVRRRGVPHRRGRGS